MNTHQVITLRVAGITFTVAYSDLSRSWIIESSNRGIHTLSHETLNRACEEILARCTTPAVG